jgi:hypothetical protein
MPANLNIMLRLRAPLARTHDKAASTTLDTEKFLRCIPIEFKMQPFNEFHRSGLWQMPLFRHSINLRLHPDMSSSLKLQIPPTLIGIEIAGERTRDIFRTRVMTFDQIAIVGVHDPHEIGEIGCGVRI